eukprot:17737_1
MQWMGNYSTCQRGKDEHDMSHVIRLKYKRHRYYETMYWDEAIGEHCNNLIPDSLKRDLTSACDCLRIDKSKLNYRNHDLTNLDGTGHMQIQDLIEPCNPTKAQLISQPTQSANTSETEIPPWIPTVFKRNPSTNVFEIQSEINDLPQCEHHELYDIIQQIFNHMVPGINRCLNVYPIASSTQQIDLSEKPNETITCSSLAANIKQKHASGKVYDEYKVVIKMTDYQFMDEAHSHYVGGDFHSEGFAEKQFIQAVALYYFDITNNVEGGGLTFRSIESGAKDSSIAVNDNDCVFFTNRGLKHKVEAMKINGKRLNDASMCADKNGKKIFGTRKLLGFFVVNPYKADKVASSMDHDVIVNVQSKAKYVVEHWYRLLVKREGIQKDVLNLIESFAFGDAKFIKSKVDEARRQRRQRYMNTMIEALLEACSGRNEYYNVTDIC